MNTIGTDRIGTGWCNLLRCISKVGIMSDIGKVDKNLAVPGVMNEGYLYDRTMWSDTKMQ